MTRNHLSKAIITRVLFASSLAMFASTASATLVTTLSPSDIHGNDTNTSSYSDSNVTLTPIRGGVPVTFNAASGRLGIDGFGSNDNSFASPTNDPSDGDEEGLILQFDALSGLQGMTWDFSRAVVSIAGFSSNPSASFTGPGNFVATNTLAFDSLGGVLSFTIPDGGFTATDGVMSLDPMASLGDTLTLLVTNDVGRTGSQVAITSITIASIPEPSAVLIWSLVGLPFVRTSRKHRRAVDNDLEKIDFA